MQLAEAIRLNARLKAAFPRMTLDEEESELLVEQITLLHDPLICNEAIDGIIKREERFPAIATLRSYYHAVQNAHRAPALPEPPRENVGIPEWVQVWRWQMSRTMTERQAVRTGTRQPIADRAPVPLRDFPQFAHPGPDAYSMDEFEKIRADWVAAGSPTLGTEELIAV